MLARPNVDLGILPARPAPMPPVWRFGGFVLYDDIPSDEPFVHVETLTRGVNVFEPDQVEVYRRAYDRLRAAAVFGDAARALLDQVVQAMRR